MALSERSRSALYVGLRGVIDDEEAVGEMLSYFPARDAEEPATKEFVRAEIAGLRAGLGGEIGALERRIHDEVQGAMRWTIGAMVSLTALIIAALAAFS